MVDREVEAAEVRLAHDGRDGRREQVLDEGAHHVPNAAPKTTPAARSATFSPEKKSAESLHLITSRAPPAVAGMGWVAPPASPRAGWALRPADTTDPGAPALLVEAGSHQRLVSG